MALCLVALGNLACLSGFQFPYFYFLRLSLQRHMDPIRVLTDFSLPLLGRVMGL